MSTALEIATYFLSKDDVEAGNFISNLKLQKLLYYAQGYHLALFDKPLFRDPIVAWAHGPVVKVVYQKYKRYKDRSIPPPQKVQFKIKKETREFLDEVYKVIGQFSAWKLRDMTHQEQPWKDTPRNGDIPLSLMEKHFDAQVV